MTRFFLFVTLIALPTLSSCSDKFTPAPPPDLRKDPYDFSVVVPPYTGPGADMMAPKTLLAKNDKKGKKKKKDDL